MHDGQTANQDVHDLTQKSSSIIPNTPFKLKLETDASRPRKKDLLVVS